MPIPILFFEKSIWIFVCPSFPSLLRHNHYTESEFPFACFYCFNIFFSSTQYINSAWFCSLYKENYTIDILLWLYCFYPKSLLFTLMWYSIVWKCHNLSYYRYTFGLFAIFSIVNSACHYIMNILKYVFWCICGRVSLGPCLGVELNASNSAR